jgi:lipopolysaccharide/colanic/teichoic acid biosynthesis glycosyltransferase
VRFEEDHVHAPPVLGPTNQADEVDQASDVLEPLRTPDWMGEQRVDEILDPPAYGPEWASDRSVTPVRQNTDASTTLIHALGTPSIGAPRRATRSRTGRWGSSADPSRLRRYMKVQWWRGRTRAILADSRQLRAAASARWRPLIYAALAAPRFEPVTARSIDGSAGELRHGGEGAGVKRLLDVVLSSILLVDLLPIMGLCALAIRLESRGPILYRQRRIGKDGRPFTMLKFRSMFADADASSHQEFVAKFIRGSADGQLTGNGQVYKLVNDARVTRVGRWLRKTSLDELPQLLNVLRGEMSLVGPRPPLPYELEHYTPADLRRLDAKPGITGLWQVSGRNKTTFSEMVALDLEYVRTQSLRLDISILLRTIPVVLEGAY